MSFIFKQPNGLYGRYSSVVDCPTHYNMTKQEVIDYFVNNAIAEAKERANKWLENPYEIEDVKEHFMPNNMSRKEFNKFLKEVEETTIKI